MKDKKKVYENADIPLSLMDIPHCLYCHGYWPSVVGVTELGGTIIEQLDTFVDFIEHFYCFKCSVISF